jgi:4-carboxymuconolactone decarboxylase
MENISSERFKNGMKKLEEIDSDAGKHVYERLNAISPFMARYLVESFSDVGALPQISNREREIANIGALTAIGYARSQLRFHINAGLNVGLTRDEIIAIINTMSIFAGFPATINALFTAQEVFRERGLA